MEERSPAHGTPRDACAYESVRKHVPMHLCVVCARICVYSYCVYSYLCVLIPVCMRVLVSVCMHVRARLERIVKCRACSRTERAFIPDATLVVDKRGVRRTALDLAREAQSDDVARELRAAGAEEFGSLMTQKSDQGSWWLP